MGEVRGVQVEQITLGVKACFRVRVQLLLSPIVDISIAVS